MAGWNNKLRRPKWRFGLRWSLRSLLILVTLSAVAARFVGAEFMAYEAEQRSLAALNKIGAVSRHEPISVVIVT